MHLSFLASDRGNQAVITVEINLDNNYEQFIKTIAPILGLQQGSDYEITIDGKTHSKADIEKAGNLKFMNLKENDLVILSPEVKLELMEISENDRLNLIRSIKLPTNIYQMREEIQHSRDGCQLYKQLKQATPNQRNSARRSFERTYPGLLDQFERCPNDKWAFLIAYRNALQKLLAAQKGGGHVSQQKRMEEEKANAALQENFEQAMHETPECIIPVDMLYIKMKLNGIEGHAFIDTGAAQSLISEDYVQRCGLDHLINKEHARQFRGIGGTQQSTGVIYKCDMTVENHELPVTLHVMPNGCAAHEVLIGLDLLLRHRALINLGARTITWSDVVTTSFLTPAESAAYSEKEREHILKREEEQLQNALQSTSGTQEKSDETMETDQK